MELFERENFLTLLHTAFTKVSSGEGHCCFIEGEAGIGKTALVRNFLKQVEEHSTQYVGACDSLFSPRPLAPIYDLAVQMNKDWMGVPSKTELFSEVIQCLTQQNQPVILVFEDIHWADKATLDFIKFLARRIVHLQCLFIVTYRDHEMDEHYSLTTILGETSVDTFSRISLSPLSRETVYELAKKKGYDAEHVYAISEGNPFYVNEILANYSPGIPDTIKDSVLSVYNSLNEIPKKFWQLVSVIPEKLELDLLTRIEPSWHQAIENCLARKVLVITDNTVHFKHELYRRTIEESLSPFKRIALHKQLLDLFLKAFEVKGELGRIVHHALHANEDALIIKYAPLAAKQAAKVGSHPEAAKLLKLAIEHMDKTDTLALVRLYEEYSHECYLSGQIENAILSQQNIVESWKEQKEHEKAVAAIVKVIGLCISHAAYVEAEKSITEGVLYCQQYALVKQKQEILSWKARLRLSGINKVQRGSRESTKNNPAQLTNRELDVLHLLAKGAPNKEIADTLFIAPKTVDHHVTSILFKLDVTSRMQAMKEASRLGIVME
jgi:DNA-binding CsgD family transcriptional regulator